jgi:hypothetical protein
MSEPKKIFGFVAATVNIKPRAFPSPIRTTGSFQRHDYREFTMRTYNRLAERRRLNFISRTARLATFVLRLQNLHNYFSISEEFPFWIILYRNPDA